MKTLLIILALFTTINVYSGDKNFARYKKAHRKTHCVLVVEYKHIFKR
jgi:hypothetical protein